jgi:hypothetical protein
MSGLRSRRMAVALLLAASAFTTVARAQLQER